MLIIAEVGPNHNGDFKTAVDLIHAAKDSGASIVKFQLYDVDKICKPDYEFYEELKRCQVSREMWEGIVKECDKIGIEFLASAFDVERVEWCQAVNMRRYKVASRSIYDTELLDAIVRTGREMIISLGMMDERGEPQVKAKFLYCVSNYPTKLEDLHLRKVDFTKYAGLSDHSPGIEACIASIVRGARIVEKHFILTDRDDDPCNSVTPSEFAQIVDFARKWEAMK